MVASASMVGAFFTSSAVIVPSARSESRCAIFSAVSSSSAGSGLKMPPGDLPVTMAHVANVTRSAASRGGTSAPSASVTASCVSTPLRSARGPRAASGGG